MTGPSSEIGLWLRLNRTFDASRERVFRAWTQPEALQGWFRPNGMESTVTQLDLRMGGSFRIELRLGDNLREIISGTYLEITPPEKLVFTWSSSATNGQSTRVTVEFIERSSTTELILTHERLADEPMVSKHRGGWESCLDMIADVLK
jgi:uncharacterized protein YndB with AHSA1/START domain